MANVNSRLLDALIQQESGGNNDAVSSRGARGLAQVMPATGRDPGFGVQPLQDNSPVEQRRFANDYLGAMLNRYGGDERKALAAYNAGPGAVDKAGGVPNFPETQNYVSKIMGALNPIGTAEASETPYKPTRAEFMAMKMQGQTKPKAIPTRAEFMAMKRAQQPQPKAETESNGIGHKLGVSARGVLEGAAGIPGDLYNLSQIVPGKITDYLKSKGITQPLPQPPRNIDTAQFGTKLSNMIGLPEANKNDNIIYPASKTVGSFVLPAAAGAKMGNKLAILMGGNNPLISSAGILAGQAASQTSKESGQSELAQGAWNIAGNMATGGVAGIAKAAGRVATRTGKAAIGAGLEGVAGRTLNRAAGDEAAIVQSALESGKVPTIKRAIAGYKPTSSEIAGNAGISTIMRQTGLDADAATLLANRAYGNVKSISDYAAKAAGTPERKALMETKGWQAVEEIAKPMRQRNASVDLTNVRQSLDNAIAQHTGNKAITKALEKVKRDLPAGTTAPFNEIYNFKQGLDEALRANTMLNPQLASLQRAKSALVETKKSIADAMTVTEPAFNDYISAQAKNIKAIGQRTAADDILSKSKLSTPMVSNASGAQEEIYPLSTNKLTALIRNPKAMDSLSPAQQRVFETAQKHAALRSRTQAGSMAGSATAQNLSVKNAVSNDLMSAAFGEKGNPLSKILAPVLGVAGKAANPLLSKFEIENHKALSSIIAKAELDPAYAAMLIKKYGLGQLNFNDSAGRAALRGMVNQYGNQKK